LLVCSGAALQTVLHFGCRMQLYIDLQQVAGLHIAVPKSSTRPKPNPPTHPTRPLVPQSEPSMSASASAASLGGADMEEDDDECVVCMAAERNAREQRGSMGGAGVGGSVGHSHPVAAWGLGGMCVDAWACALQGLLPVVYVGTRLLLLCGLVNSAELPRLTFSFPLAPCAVCMPCGHRNLCSNCARQFVERR